MKACVVVLLVGAVMQGTARPEEKLPSVGKGQPAREASQMPESSDAAFAELKKAHDRALAEVERAWKIATEIRERYEIIDAAPHRESVPVAHSSKTEELQAYLAAKRVYLQANVDCHAKGEIASKARTGAVEKARANAAYAYKVAAALREQFEIIDPDPASDGVMISSHAENSSDLQVYLEAKADYLNAKAELDRFAKFKCEITSKEMEVMMGNSERQRDRGRFPRR